MSKIEQVVVGTNIRTPVPEIKSEPDDDLLRLYRPESLQCHICLITFSTFNAMDRHMRRSHRELYKQILQQKKTEFTCYRCEKFFFSSEELSLHQATHSKDEKAFTCRFCTESFFSYTELTQHRRNECTEQRCPCVECGSMFSTPSRLRAHRMAVHPDLPAVGGVPKSWLTYKCFKCDKAFQKKEDLLEHQKRLADNPNCEVTGQKRGRNPKHVVQMEELHDKKIKQEEGTDESLAEGSSSTEPQIPCPEADCDLVFSSVDALRAHKKDTHGRLK
ncbi:uncharacterized protein KZ484_007045 isoform 1-T2 [Pholidichthys leucotaenia]